MLSWKGFSAVGLSVVSGCFCLRYSKVSRGFILSSNVDFCVSNPNINIILLNLIFLKLQVSIIDCFLLRML